MADQDNSIEVNLRLFQEQEMRRLAQFSRDFRNSVDTLTSAMASQVQQVSNLAQGGPTNTTSGQSRSGPAGQSFAHADTLSAKDAQIKAQQMVSFDRQMRSQAQNASASTIMQNQASRTSATTGGVPPQYSGGGPWENTGRGPVQHGVIAPFLQRHRNFIEQAALFGGAVHTSKQMVENYINNPISASAQSLGYQRGGLFGTTQEGFAAGFGGKWKAAQAGAFGLNPFVQGEFELQRTMSSLGFDINKPQHGFMYDKLIGLGKKWGIDTSEAAKFIEGTQRFHPEDLPKVMDELDKLGESAQKAGLGVAAFSKGVMEGAATLSNQYGVGRSHFMQGLREFGAQTGLNPSVGAQLAGNQQMVWGTVARTGQTHLETIQNPDSILETSRGYIESTLASTVPGFSFDNWDAMTPEQQEAIKNAYSIYSTDPQFQSMTNGMLIEQFVTSASREKAGSRDASAAKKYIESDDFWGDGVTGNELDTALQKYYKDDAVGMRQFKSLYGEEGMGLSFEDQAKALADMAGAENPNNSITLRLTGKAAELLEFSDGSDAISWANAALNPVGAIAGKIVGG